MDLKTFIYTLTTFYNVEKNELEHLLIHKTTLTD